MKFSVRAVDVARHLEIVKNHSCDYDEAGVYGLSVEQKLVEGDGSLDSPYKVQVSVKNDSGHDFEGIVLLALGSDGAAGAECPAGSDSRFYLPGFMYGSNRGDQPWKVDCKFPRLRASVKNPADSDCPLSSFYMVRSDRLSHPCAVMLSGGSASGSRLLAFHTSPYIFDNDDFAQYGGFYCNADRGEIGFTLGYENAPWLFIQSHTIKPRQTEGNYIKLAAGGEIKKDFYLYDFEASSPLAVHDVIRKVYDFYHEVPRDAASVEEAVKDLSLAVCDYAWLSDEKIYSGFVRETEKAGVFSYNKIPSISWTNGIVVAYPQLVAAQRLKNQKMREQALECINHIVQNSLNQKSKLPYETYDEARGWSCHGWWYDGMHSGGHSAYLDGQFVYYLLKAYLFEKENGTEHKDWLDFAAGVVQAFERERNRAGEYPFIFSEVDGTGIEYDSLGSCWCLAASTLYAIVSGDTEGLPELEKSADHYYKHFIERLECYGSPLDTDKAPDNEGVLAFIRAARCLHQITKKEVYLEYMKNALYQEFSYKFCYNGRITVPPLSEIGWSACGGSITSVCNPHIHPMSSSIVGEMKYFVEHCPDNASNAEARRYIQSRLDDTVKWGCQTYNLFDGQYGYGKKGWMSERFCYSQGLVVEKYPDGRLASTWFALMPWASSSVLEGLLEVK